MKKATALLLCLLLALSLLAACGQQDGTEDSKNPTSSSPNTGDPIEDMAEGVGDMAQGVTNGVRDVWDGLMNAFDMDTAPKTVEGTSEIFARDYGLDENLLDDYTLRTSQDENTPAEFFIARVKDGNMAKVEEGLEKRKAAIAAQWASSTDETVAYARQPVIMKNGNYIMLAVHSDLEKAKAEFERLTKEK